MLRPGGQEKAMLAQRLEGGEGMSHGDMWARAFPADGTVGSQGECVFGLLEITPLPEEVTFGKRILRKRELSFPNSRQTKSKVK